MSEENRQQVTTEFKGDDSPLMKAIGRIVGAGHRLNETFNHASDVLGGVS